MHHQPPRARARTLVYDGSVFGDGNWAALAMRLQVLANSFSDSAGQPLTLDVGIDCGPMIGKIIGIERSFWCLFGSPINTAARLASLSRKTQACERALAVVTAGAAEAFRRAHSRIAEGLLDPGFAVASMGHHVVKGVGDMEVFSILQSDPNFCKSERNLGSIQEEGVGSGAGHEASSLYTSFSERAQVNMEPVGNVRCPLRSPSNSPVRDHATKTQSRRVKPSTLDIALLESAAHNDGAVPAQHVGSDGEPQAKRRSPADEVLVKGRRLVRPKVSKAFATLPDIVIDQVADELQKYVRGTESPDERPESPFEFEPLVRTGSPMTSSSSPGQVGHDNNGLESMSDEEGESQPADFQSAGLRRLREDMFYPDSNACSEVPSSLDTSQASSLAATPHGSFRGANLSFRQGSSKRRPSTSGVEADAVITSSLMSTHVAENARRHSSAEILLHDQPPPPPATRRGSLPGQHKNIPEFKKTTWLEKVSTSNSNIMTSSTQLSSSSGSRLMAGDIEWFSDSDSCPSAQDNSSFAYSTSSRLSVSRFHGSREDPSLSSDEEGQTDAPAKPHRPNARKQKAEAGTPAKTKKELKPGFFRQSRASRIPAPDPLPAQSEETPADLLYKAFLRVGEREVPAEADEGSFRNVQDAPSATGRSSPCPGGPTLWHAPLETSTSSGIGRSASYESAGKGPDCRSWTSFLTRSLEGLTRLSSTSGSFQLSASFHGSFRESFGFGKTFGKTGFFMASMKTVSKTFFGSQICRVPTKRRRAETFRIELPNGSRIAGLSTMTFGDEKRTALDRSTYVFGRL